MNPPIFTARTERRLTSASLLTGGGIMGFQPIELAIKPDLVFRRLYLAFWVTNLTFGRATAVLDLLDGGSVVETLEVEARINSTTVAATPPERIAPDNGLANAGEAPFLVSSAAYGTLLTPPVYSVPDAVLFRRQVNTFDVQLVAFPTRTVQKADRAIIRVDQSGVTLSADGLAFIAGGVVSSNLNF